MWTQTQPAGLHTAAPFEGSKLHSRVAKITSLIPLALVGQPGSGSQCWCVALYTQTFPLWGSDCAILQLTVMRGL